MFTWLDLTDAKSALPVARAPRIRNEQVTGYTQGWQQFSSVAVSQEQAMRASAVLACIRILTEDVGGLPICIKQKTARGWEETQNPLNPILSRQPNPYMSSVELREHMIMDCLIYGHFANWVLRDSRGVIAAIYPLRANLLSRVSPVTIPQAALRSGLQPINYLYAGTEYSGKNQFTNFELWRGTLLPDSYIVDPYLQRHSLTLLCREAIGLSLAAERQASRLFVNGLQSGMAIVSAESIDAQDKKELREYFEQNQGVNHAWRPLVLESGIDVKSIAITPEESQFLESRKFQLSDIARCFRIPEVMLGATENTASYGSAEQYFLSYIKNAIVPWTRRLETTGERDLFREDESDLYIKHDLTGLLRADQLTRFRCWQIAISAGFLSRNEVRIAEGYDKQEGLDEFLTSVTTQPDTVADSVDPVAPVDRNALAKQLLPDYLQII